MSTLARRFATYLMIALFAAAVAGGEAWHSVPGCGHWIELPGGYLAWGFSISNGSLRAAEPVPATAPKSEPQAPLKADCSVCQLTGKASPLSPVATCLRVVPANDRTPHRSVQPLGRSAIRSIRIRGPPSV